MRTALVAAFCIVAAGSPALAQDDKKKDEAKAPDDAAVEKKLSEQKINLNFDDTPFADAVDTIVELTSLPFVLTPAATAQVEQKQTKVALKETDMTVKAVLDKILGKEKLAYEVWKGAVFILTKAEADKKERPAPIKLEGEAKKKLEGQKVTFNFNDTPLSEALQFLQDFTHVTFELAEKFDAEGVKVSLRLRSVTAADALAIIARVAGLEVTQKKDSLVVGPKAQKKK